MKKVLLSLLGIFLVSSFGVSLHGKGVHQLRSKTQLKVGRTNTSNVTVKSCSPKAFNLKPGTSKNINIYGANLKQVASIKVVRNNQVAYAFKYRITRKSVSMLSVTITAQASAKPAQYYQLRLVNRGGRTLFTIPKRTFRFSIPQPSGSSSPPAQTKPDLVISNIVQDPSNPMKGQTWKFKVTIKNQGTADAFIPKGRQYMAHNGKGSWSGISAGSNLTIKPGQTYIGQQYASALPVGTHSITYKADPENLVTESNESNNQKTTTYTVKSAQGKPDLVITNIVVQPANPTTAQVKLVVTIKNQGTNVSNLQGTHLILKSTNTNNIEQTGNLKLDPGQSKSVTCYATNLVAGTFTWTIKVDPQNKVAEASESNNTKNVQLTIKDAGGKPDLIVTNIVQDPSNPMKGVTWKFKVTIKNQGTADAFIPKGRQYMAHNGKGSWSGISVGTNLTIKPGNTYTGQQYASALPVGTHSISYKADPQNVVTESDEGNNRKTTTYTVKSAQGKPDLVITTIVLQPANPTTAQVKLVVTIKNQGTNVSNLQGTHLILKSTNTNNIKQTGNLKLDPGQSKTVTCYAANLKAGTFTWTIKVDPDNKVLESKENNNSKNVTLTIK